MLRRNLLIFVVLCLVTQVGALNSIAEAPAPAYSVDGDLIADEYFFTLGGNIRQGSDLPSMRVKLNGLGETIAYQESMACQFLAYKPIGLTNDAWIETCRTEGKRKVAVIYNGESYGAIGNPNQIDAHDFHIDDNDNIYTFIYNHQGENTPFGFIIQKQDKNHNLLWEWDSENYMSPSEAILPAHRGSDWAHVNSIDSLYPLVILSLRHTNSVIAINERSNEIAWQLGGSKNSFNPTGKAPFHFTCFQHTARFIDQDTISIFDNGNYCRSYSRGVVVDLDFINMSVKQVSEIAPRAIMFNAAGSYEVTGESHLLGWGFSPLRDGIFASEVNGETVTNFKTINKEYRNYQIYRRFANSGRSYMPLVGK